MEEHENDNGHARQEVDVLMINGRERIVYGEMVLLDHQGTGLLLLIVTEPEEDAPALVAIASVFRPDLKLRLTDENATPLDGNRYAAETFAVMPAEVAAGIVQVDLLERLAGMSDCPECQAEAEAAAAEEAGEEGAGSDPA